jgi:hypothetical protein
VIWLLTACIAGALYLAAGTISAALAAAAHPGPAQFLARASAFGISAVILALHVAHERLRLGSATMRAAWHGAIGAALGGLALAIMANVHDLGSASGYRPRMLVALVAWPFITAVPAFVVALVVAAVVRKRV